MELMFGAVALAPVIAALVEMCKKLGLASGYAPYVNAALSVLAYSIVVTAGRNPALVEPVTLLLNALVIFLSAAGFYETVRYAAKRLKAER